MHRASIPGSGWSKRMSHRTFSIFATDCDIHNLVRAPGAGTLSHALDMFPFSSEETEWTAERLENVIAGYGVFAPEDDPVTRELLEYHGVQRFQITTLLGRADRDDIIENEIRVDRKNLYGLDPARYLGMVHYDDVPLSGFPSNLPARFHIMRVGAGRLTLEFLDIHVM